MKPSPPPLHERLRDTTRECIVVAAADEIQAHGTVALTSASVAARAGVSERTVYRHFTNRGLLLAAVAVEVSRRLSTPPVPDDPAALGGYTAALFARFEAQPALTREALTSDLFGHMRDSRAAERWCALRALIDRHWPYLPDQRRALAAVNLRYLLTATTWHYHRTHLALDASDTESAVQHAVGCVLSALGPPASATPTPTPRDRAR